MHRIAGVVAAVVVVAGTLGSAAQPVAAGGAAPQSVIVIFSDAVGDPGSLAAEVGRAHGFSLRHVYTSALHGFSATVPNAAMAALERNPNVLSVESETVEQVADTPPTGIDRIEEDRLLPGLTTSDGVDVNAHVAIIDTGIYRHAELEVVGGYNATSRNRTDWLDGNGHGTHVAFGLLGRRMRRWIEAAGN